MGARLPSSAAAQRRPRGVTCLPLGAGAQSELSPARACSAAMVARWPQVPHERSLPAVDGRAVQSPDAFAPVSLVPAPVPSRRPAGHRPRSLSPAPGSLKCPRILSLLTSRGGLCIRPSPLFFPGYVWLRRCEPGRCLMSSSLTPPARCGSVL